MTKKGYIKFLGVLLVVGLLFAAAPVGRAQAATVIPMGDGYATQLGADAISTDHFIGTGAWSSNGTMMEFYLDPSAAPLNLGAITVDQVDNVVFRTKDGTDGGVDWGFYIYTKGTKYGWYEERLISEPMYSIAYNNAPANTWNTWDANGAVNQLAFYDSHYSAMGFYYGPTLTTIKAGLIDWSTYGYTETHIDYGAQEVKYFKFGTGSAWSSTFFGLLDAIELTVNGVVYTIDLEEFVPVTYVDDDWAALSFGVDPDGNGPAVAFGNDAFATIQQAINATAPGGTVYVADGTYHENLVVNKSLNLIGAGIDETIVQAVKGRNYNGGGSQSPIVSITGDAALLNLYPINITAPGGIAGPMKGSLAAFGPLPGEEGWAISGEVVYASDPVGCTVPTNVVGKIALIDRGGGCTFIVKADNAQKAGAIGVIIANTDDTLITMGSTPGYDITIPVTMITKTNADSLKAQTPPVTANFQADPYGPGGVTISGFTFHGNVPTTVPSNWSSGGIDGLSTQGIETDSSVYPYPARQNIHITNNKFVYAGASVALYNTVGFEVSDNIMERATYEYAGFGFKPHGGNIAHVSGGLNGTIEDNVGFNPEGTISVNASKVNVLGNIITAPEGPLSGDLDIAQYGIFVMSAAHVNIEDNTISGLKAGPKSSFNNGWPGEGIWVFSNASDVTIIGNTLAGNVIGVHVEDAPAVGGPVLRRNQFIGNVYSVLNQKGNIGTAVNTVDAKENYWNSEVGPNVYSVTEMGATTWAAFYDLVNGTNPPFPEFAVSDKVDFAPWCSDEDCGTLMPNEDGVVELSGEINIPGGIQVDVPHITYHLAADTIIQNSSPCFVVNASYTQIIAEPGAKCIPTGGANGIDVAAGLTDIRVKGLEIYAPEGAIAGNGINFAGAVHGTVLVNNKIHNMPGHGIFFGDQPDGVQDIHGNLFQNNGGNGIEAGTFTVAAEYNSWGSYAGPAVASGGDGVSANVDAEPWTHADITVAPVISNTTSRVVTSLANVSGRPTVLKDGNVYHMWYGPDDTHLYHTSSTNPAEFPAGFETTFDEKPIEVASPAIIKEADGFKMIAYGADNSEFALYTSADGTAWTKGLVVFDGTSKFTDFVKVDAPFLFKTETAYRLYFQVKTGSGVTERYNIYAADSTTIGGTYALVNSGNPVLSPAADIAAWDGKYVMHPWVVKEGDTYYMWYSAHNDTNQRIGVATSTDGLAWTKSTANPVIGPVGEPAVIKDGSIWRIWYLGEGNSVKYETALNPLDLRQTLAYQVTANLQNVIAADVTLNFPKDLLSIAEITPGTAFNSSAFITATDGKIQFVGSKLDTPVVPVTGEGVVLFTVAFHTDIQGSGDIAFGPATFGMPGVGSSSNVYLAASADTASAQVNELPTLATTFGDAYYLVGDAQTFQVVITNKGTAYTNAELRLGVPTGVALTLNTSGYTLLSGVVGLGQLEANETVTLEFSATISSAGAKTISFDVYDASNLLFSTVETATVYDKPTLTSTDIQGYYLVGEERAFHVQVVNPATGGSFTSIYYNFEIADAVPADIATLVCGGQTISLSQSGTKLVGSTGPFPMPAGQSWNTPCSVKFNTAKNYAFTVYMTDSIPDPDRTLVTYTQTANVYTRPTLTSVDIVGPYLAGVAQDFHVTVNNPATGGNFVNSIYYVFTVANAELEDIFSLTCEFVPGSPTAVTLNDIGDDLVGRVGYGTTGFPMASGFSTTTTCNVKFKNAGSYSFTVDMVDNPSGVLANDRILVSMSKTATVNSGFAITGTFSMQGNASRAGIPVTLTWAGTGWTYAASDNTEDLLVNNFQVTVTYGGDYTITTLQPRYLNVTSDLLKKITVAGPYPMSALILKGGNAYWKATADTYDNIINGSDASLVGGQYGSAGSFTAIGNHGDCNFDGIVNIQDLALVGGNYDLTSATAYSSWLE